MILCPIWKSSLAHVFAGGGLCQLCESTAAASSSTAQAFPYLWDINDDLKGQYNFVVLPPSSFTSLPVQVRIL